MASKYDDYDKNIDYAAKYNEYSRLGDYAEAADAENYRNAKIDGGDGEGYAKGSIFSSYTQGNGTENGATYARPTYTSTAKAPETFSYSSAPTFTSKYDNQISDLVDRIANRASFSYDQNSDPLFANYAKQYNREGQRASQNALAQAANMTGGMPSTAAVMASQQAGNYYASQLADKVPELYRLAYSMYQDEGNNMRNNLSMYQGLDNTDYNRYLTDLGQYNTDRNFLYNDYMNRVNQYNNDRNFEYGQYLNDMNQWNSDRNFNYSTLRDNTADQRYIEELDYNRNQAAEANAYNRQQAQQAQAQDYISNYIKNYGNPDNIPASVIQNSGWDTGYLQQLARGFAMQTGYDNGYLYSPEEMVAMASGPSYYVPSYSAPRSSYNGNNASSAPASASTSNNTTATNAKLNNLAQGYYRNNNNSTPSTQTSKPASSSNNSSNKDLDDLRKLLNGGTANYGGYRGR